MNFSHRDAGTAEAVWAASGLDALPELPLDAGELEAMTFVVLAAHPDDETLGAGGLLAKLHAAGAAIEVLLCTAGEASHPESQTTTAEQLAAVRLSEFQTAVTGLAPSAAWRFMELRDGQLASDPSPIAAAVREAITRPGCPAERVAIVAPYRGDGHTDHDVLGTVAAEVANEGGHGLLEYPIWYWLWASPEDPTWKSWVQVPLAPEEQHAKAKAMRSHASQTNPLSDQPGDETLLSEAFLEHFSRPRELFAWHPSQAGTNSANDAERIFDAVHTRDEDPWKYTSSWYERRKRALTMAVLSEENYDSGLELGCSIGTLSVDLAQRCRQFLAVDASSAALARAAERLYPYPSAQTRQLTFPRDWPEERFDLVVMSEMGYYLAQDELTDLLRRVEASTEPGGTLVLCHWRHPISGWRLDGEAVHDLARSQLRWRTRGLYREKDFVLEVLVAPTRLA